jgi:predicted PurR-regulated permease PerM
MSLPKELHITVERLAKNNVQVNQALEVSIQIGLAALLVVGCLLILRPFIPLIMWGVIIAIASYPTFQKLQRVLRGRGGLAAVLWTLLLLAILILPIFLLGQSLVEGIQPLATRLKDGTLTVPPPPPTIEHWPIIGAPLARAWSMASTNLTDAVTRLGPQIKSVLPGILSASAGIGFTVLQFFLSVLVSGVLLANARAAAELTRALARRLFGDRGPEFERLVGSTIRSVTFGILGVALIQSALGVIGFLVMGLPGASVWAAVFLFAAVLQMGALVLIPAVIYAFATATTTKAVIFLVWCIFLAVIDNVLKPLLLGRGAAVPVAVVFLGAIGGFVVMGIIGLFVGAIVLSVGYKLFLAWIEGTAADQKPA